MSPDLALYSAVSIWRAGLGPRRDPAELDAHYYNRIFLSGSSRTRSSRWRCLVGDRLGIDLYLVALFAFGLRIFQNVALIRRHFL